MINDDRTACELIQSLKFISNAMVYFKTVDFHNSDFKIR